MVQSVPRILIYPKFDILANLYLNLADERKMLNAKVLTWKELQALKTTFTPSLTDEWVLRKRSYSISKRERRPTFSGGEGDDGEGFEGKYEENKTEGEVQEDSQAQQSIWCITIESIAKSFKHDDENMNDETPIRLSIDSTPEFMRYHWNTKDIAHIQLYIVMHYYCLVILR